MQAAGQCDSITGAGQVLTLAGAVVMVGGSMLVAWLAGRYRDLDVSTWRRQLGLTLQWTGFLSFGVCYALYLLYRHPDSCGRPSSGWIGLGLAASVMGMLGVMIKNSSEWGTIACVACLDLGLAVSLTGGIVSGQRSLGTSITVLGVHGLCTSVAAWWSWRARGSTDGAVRARASEAGRTLAAGWLVLAVLAVSSSLFGQGAASMTVSDNTVLSIFVITAIGLVTGSGYTKYAEAMAAMSTKRPASTVPAPVPTRPGRGLAATLVVLSVFLRLSTRSRREQIPPPGCS